MACRIGNTGVGGVLPILLALFGGSSAAFAQDTGQIATLAALTALSTATYSHATRMGYLASGDSPPVVYAASSSACTLNSGSGDNGSQVPSADGKCWLATFDGAADLRIWGADPTAAHDSTTAINNAFASGASLYCAPGTYKVSALTLNAANVSLTGPGRACTIQWSNATGDVLTIGSSAANLSGVSISGIRFAGVTKTSGRTIFAQRTTNLTLANIFMDDGNTYDGIELAQFNTASITNAQITSCLHDGIRVYGGNTMGAAQLYIDPVTFVSHCAHDGIVIGGGTGGVELEASVFTAGRYGLYMTSSLAVGGPMVNREIFIGSKFEADSSVSAGAYFDTNSVAFLHSNGGWYSGTTSGPGINIQSQGGGYFNFNGIQAFHNSAQAIVDADGGILMVEGSRIQNNGFYGSGSDAILLNNLGNTAQTLIEDNVIGNNGFGGTGYGINDYGTLGYLTITANHLLGNAQGSLHHAASVVYCRFEQNTGYNPGGAGTVAVSASPFTLPSSCSPQTFYITGGTVTNITLNGQPIGASLSSVDIDTGITAVVTYSATPTIIQSVH
jgi:hypothetical protein